MSARTHGCTGVVRALLGAIEAEGLERTYRRAVRSPGLGGALRHVLRPKYEYVPALAGLDLTVSPGERVGYVGVNGAGKSTSVKLFTGVIRPTGGTVRVNGVDPVRRRQYNASHIGVVWGQRNHMWWDLPVRESYLALRHIYGVEPLRFRRNLDRITKLLSLAELMPVPVRQLSLGQRTRVNIGIALLHDPAIVFLDEPTIGLDLFVKEQVRAALLDMHAERGMTVLLTSHDLADVEHLCDRIVVLSRGRVTFDGSMAMALSRHATERTLRVTTRQPAEHALVDLPGVAVDRPGPHEVLVRFDSRTLPAARVVSALLDAYDVADLSVEEPSLEQVIRALSGNASSGEPG